MRTYTSDAPPIYQGLQGAGWWGCVDWIIKGKAPREYPEMNAVAALVEKVEADLPGEEVKFGLHRFDDKGLVCRHIENEKGYGVSSVYLPWVEAYAEVDEWRWVRGLAELPKAPYGLAGLRDNELVAVIAPTRDAGVATDG